MVSTCCSKCSTKDVLVILHKPEVKYGESCKSFRCLTEHRRHPSRTHRTVRMEGKSRAAKKRVREHGMACHRVDD